MQHRSVIKYMLLVQEIPAVVMELAEHGTLLDFLKKSTSPIGTLLDDNLTWKNGA